MIIKSILIIGMMYAIPFMLLLLAGILMAIYNNIKWGSPKYYIYDNSVYRIRKPYIIRDDIEITRYFEPTNGWDDYIYTYYIKDDIIKDDIIKEGILLSGSELIRELDSRKMIWELSK